jgi:hypothetical protein
MRRTLISTLLAAWVYVLRASAPVLRPCFWYTCTGVHGLHPTINKPWLITFCTQKLNHSTLVWHGETWIVTRLFSGLPHTSLRWTVAQTVVLQLQSTYHELIPARNASLAAIQGSGAEVMFVTIQRENIHRSNKEINKAVTMLKLSDVCTTSPYRWLIASLPSTCMLCSPRTAVRTFTSRRDQLMICGEKQ